MYVPTYVQTYLTYICRYVALRKAVQRFIALIASHLQYIPRHLKLAHRDTASFDVFVRYFGAI